MARTSEHQALVLHVRASGEANREATFLTADAGLIRATLFGGPKSKLRAHIAPYHRGVLWLYRDPVRDSFKVTDFDVRDWRPGLREGLERSLDASALAETVIICSGSGGDWEAALRLADEALDTMATAETAKVRPTLLRFLWKWSALLGLRPDTSRCADCGAGLGESAEMCYVQNDGRLICAACAEAETDRRPLGKGARLWLDAVDRLNAAAAYRVSLDIAGLRQVEYLVRTVIEAAAGTRLKSMDS